MNSQQDSVMPSYYIYRNTSADEPFDLTAPLQFFPPKNSDELFFALREAFPTISTHSERMRAAVIQFLLSEGQSENGIVDLHSSSTSPYSTHVSTTSSGSSLSASPSLFDNTSPRMITSPSITGEPSHTIERQRPALEQMTSVFSLSSDARPKLRSRRKMTEAEKVEYRKRRSAGACAICSAQKRKCKHNKDQGSSPPTFAKRVSKSLSQKARGKQVQVQPSTSTSTSTSVRPPSASQSTSMNAPPLPVFGDHDLFDLMTFDSEALPWGTESDWTLLDAPSTTSPFLSTSHIFEPRPANSLLSHRSGAMSNYDLPGQQLIELFGDNDGPSLAPQTVLGASHSAPAQSQALVLATDAEQARDGPLAARHRTYSTEIFARPSTQRLQATARDSTADLAIASDPAAAASVKERQSLTLRDSGQSSTAGPLMSTELIAAGRNASALLAAQMIPSLQRIEGASQSNPSPRISAAASQSPVPVDQTLLRVQALRRGRQYATPVPVIDQQSAMEVEDNNVLAVPQSNSKLGMAASLSATEPEHVLQVRQESQTPQTLTQEQLLQIRTESQSPQTLTQEQLLQVRTESPLFAAPEPEHILQAKAESTPQTLTQEQLLLIRTELQKQSSAQKMTPSAQEASTTSANSPSSVPVVSPMALLEYLRLVGEIQKCFMCAALLSKEQAARKHIMAPSFTPDETLEWYCKRACAVALKVA